MKKVTFVFEPTRVANFTTEMTDKGAEKLMKAILPTNVISAIWKRIYAADMMRFRSSDGTTHFVRVKSVVGITFKDIPGEK